MNKSVMGILAVIIVIALGAWAFMGSNTAPSDATQTPDQMGGETNTGTDTTSGEVAGTQKSYTLAEIQTHNNAESCWSAIEGKVYDLTDWISKHPGGPQAILGNLCGKDGTAAFTAQHDHAQMQQNILKTYFIGSLAS
jgi:cytochrome b involved in lipid metabolism